jgi:dTDP-4-amino-4,6-dideoxygalactose transaminase
MVNHHQITTINLRVFMDIPFLRPQPPRLSSLTQELLAIENSGIFTNYGPVNTRFEKDVIDYFFSGRGGCVTSNNATIALMLAMAEAVGGRVAGRRFALMPSFTFAATAQAAMWAGLTPLLCDVEPDTWLPCRRSEDALLERYGDEVALVVPYATFGNNLDLDRYIELSAKRSIPVVVDAAASLGSVAVNGLGFGCDAPFSVVFSMHATKTFATSEGGVTYTADKDRLARLRAMGNFGFSIPRTATMLGLNGKLSEVAALIASERLRDFDTIVAHRVKLAETYRAALSPQFSFQTEIGERLAYQFMPVLLPEECADRRTEIISGLSKHGIGAATYFSPHLAEQPFFAEACVTGDLDNTKAISRRAISLPMSDLMVCEEVMKICETLNAIVSEGKAVV